MRVENEGSNHLKHISAEMETLLVAVIAIEGLFAFRFGHYFFFVPQSSFMFL